MMSVDVLSRVDVVKFNDELHSDDLVQALLMTKIVGVTYPPNEEAVANIDSLDSWLFDSASSRRWVAIADGEVAGHIMVTNPHSYLDSSLTPLGYDIDMVSEVAKFFVSPKHQGYGVGSLLFETAREWIAGKGKVAALAVLDSSVNALEFYPKNDMAVVATFTGETTGQLNHVFIARADIIQNQSS